MSTGGSSSTKSGVAGGSTALAMFASYRESEAESEALQFNAQQQYREAQELKRRANINALADLREGGDLQARQLSSYAASGVELTSGSPLTAFADTAEKVARQVKYDLEAAEYTANQKELEASNTMNQAQEIERMKYLKALQAGISTAAQYM